jgi:hypothetical protein
MTGTMRCNNCNKETRVMFWDLCIDCTRKLAIDNPINNNDDDINT